MARHANAKAMADKQVQIHQAQQLETVTESFASLRMLEASERNQGLATDPIKSRFSAISHLIARGNYSQATAEISTDQRALTVLLASKQSSDAAAEAKLGLLGGTVSDGTGPLIGVAVSLSSNGQAIAATVTDAAGGYRLTVPAGSYSLQASLAGYVASDPQTVNVQALNLLTQTIVLLKAPPPATPTPAPAPTPPPTPRPTPKPIVAPPPTSTGDSAPYSTYSHTTLNGHTADIMTFDLSSGHIRVMVDTANDTDCTNNCNVQSVASFVQQDHGFAGINGSYFCPTAYGASCAGKTNTFYWKEYNSRVQRMINSDNLLGEQDPFIVFAADGHATFVQHWAGYQSAGPLYAGFSCKPILIYNGQNVLQDADMDDKERTAHVSRAAIALKGQTLYSVVIQGATVPDLAAALMSLGVDAAVNSDAGGSSGMYYNGQYRLGPGRAVPNALVFVEQ